MKIWEARQTYRTQIKEYQEQYHLLSEQKKKLEKKMDMEKDGHIVYANEAASLELTLDAVKEKKDEYQEYMEKILEQWAAVANLESAKQQGEAMEEYAEDLGKIMEVARRLMKGGIVPPTDEKKLMDYSMELYQAAKNMGMLMQQKKREEYDSLWEDEEEKEAPEDPTDIADHTECGAAGPEIVSVADTMAGAGVE